MPALALIAACGWSGTGRAEDVDRLRTFVSRMMPRHSCFDERLGVRFACNRHWELQSEDGVILLIIDHSPDVTLTIAKSDRYVSRLDALTPEVLAELGQYREGFRSQKVSLANATGVQVEGEARGLPGMKLYDHYLFHRGKFYSILFSVDPADQWPKYRTVIEKILGSLEFIDDAENPGP